MIGTRLSGRYKILEVIGGGGMANVYRAHDMILHRDVAVKVLRPDFSDDEEFIKRFHREAHSTTSLDHPNIVSIFDVGEENGIYFLVMEYVDGQTLKQYIQQNGPLSVEETRRIMLQITSALEHAHHNQIVHRDIKPHNILIDYNGNVKVTDFGIAIALSATSITQTNSVLGSVHYISPEQARGGTANQKSDIYSLGILMFELLTGRLPFAGESAVSIALKHLQSVTPSPKRWNASIPQSVENIILKATTKDPFHRYDSVTEMKEDIETALDASRLNEPKFTVPIDDEVTKAIPVITDDIKLTVNGDTIVHSPTQPLNNEVTKKEKKNKLKKIIIFSSVILLLLILAAFVFLSVFFKSEDVVIPDLRGKDITIAMEKLEQLGLTVTTEKRHDPEIPQGMVIKTDPGVNSKVKKGYDVLIYESIGPEKVAFENYEGMSLEEATRALVLKGVKEENINAYKKDSNAPVNEIIAQLEPKPGEEINPNEMGEVTVFFEISQGPKQEMPAMKGWTEEEVHQFVEKNNLNLDRSVDGVYSDEIKKGLVVKQTPMPGVELSKGDTIEIILSKGAEPKKYTVKAIIPFDSASDVEEQKVEIFVNDQNNKIEDVYDTVTITESAEISFEILVPYEGQASYKIYREGEFIVSDIIRYENLPD